MTKASGGRQPPDGSRHQGADAPRSPTIATNFPAGVIRRSHPIAFPASWRSGSSNPTMSSKFSLALTNSKTAERNEDEMHRVLLLGSCNDTAG